MVLLIVVCSLASWSVHWREVGTRLGIDITLLLVAVACKQVKSSPFPPRLLKFVANLRHFATVLTSNSCKQDLASATADISYDWPILCPFPGPIPCPIPVNVF